VEVVGGLSGGTAVTGAYEDTSASGANGLRLKTVFDPAILSAADAVTLATNWVTYYSGGDGRYHVALDGASERIEASRLTASLPLSPYTGTGRATVRGIDGAKVLTQFTSIEYRYEPGCAARLTVLIDAGLPSDTLDAIIGSLARKVDSLVSAMQQMGTQPVLGAPVASWTSVAPNDDPNLTLVQGRVATTNATPTTLMSIAMVASRTYQFEARVVARRTGGASGTADDGAVYFVRGGFTTKTGTVTLLGSLTVEAAEDVAGWDATLAAGSGAVDVVVTGAVTTGVTWHATVAYSWVGT